MRRVRDLTDKIAADHRVRLARSHADRIDIAWFFGNTAMDMNGAALLGKPAGPAGVRRSCLARLSHYFC